MLSSREYIEQFQEESGLSKAWTSLDSLPLHMTRYFISTLRATTLFLIIALGFMSDDEVQRCSFAVVLHAAACVVTTIVVFWNNKQTMHSFKQGCEFWFMNFLFLTETLPSCNNRKSNHVTREYPWYQNNYLNLCILKLSSNKYRKQLEGKIKETYTRLCMCFFTNIPSAFLQAHFLFQSLERINELGWDWLDVVRAVLTATTIFELAITATMYEGYCHGYTVLLYRLDKEVRPRGHTREPENFRFWRIFQLQFLTITQWLFNSTYFFAISGYHMTIYMLFTFFLNYITLKMIPEIENSYINFPYGFHSVPTFWTSRIINSVSSVCTRLNQNSIHHVNQLIEFHREWRSLLRIVFLCALQLQISFVTKTYPDCNGNTSDNCRYFRSRVVFALSIIRIMFDILEECYVHVVKANNDSHEVIRRIRCQDHYPLLTGYTFYNILFEQVCDNIVTLRTLMVTSLSIRMDFYRNYRRLLNDRDFTVHILRDQYITELPVMPDIDSVIRQIEGIRTIKVDEEFPFVLEFDEFMSVILKNENNEETIRDLKLLCLFYEYIDHAVQHLTSDKIIKIFEVMGVTLEKEDFGEIRNESWFDRWLGFCAR